MLFNLAQAAKWLNLPPLADTNVDAVKITGVSQDSRLVQRGDLFVAIKGQRHDAHDSLAEVAAKGAVAALVERPNKKINLPQLIVPNTVLALGRLAAQYRAQFSIPVIALTGSVGKTTVKEMLAQILQQSQSVLYSSGNFNTDIGLPLTLLRLTPEHDIAVIEMGARNVGEIAYLAGLAKPSIALITNIGINHIEVFGSVENIAKGKGELFEALPEAGTAIIWMDDPNLAPWNKKLTTQNRIRVRLAAAPDANLWAEDCQVLPDRCQLTLVYKNQQKVAIQLPIPGEHNITNALLAAAGAIAAGLTLPQIQQGLNTFKPFVAGRLQLKKGRLGATIIDDTYNASPPSMLAAFKVLAQQKGVPIVVMGDMFELADTAPQHHHDMGREAQTLGIAHFIGFGPFSAKAAQGFGEKGIHCETLEAVLAAIEPLLLQYKEQAVILVKGSRGMKMERVVEALC